MKTSQAEMLAFAQQHDWGRDVTAVGDDAVCVAGLEQLGGSYENGNWERIAFIAHNMQELRRWAGY